MKKLSDSEKLDMTVEFIKKIYNNDFPVNWIEDSYGNDIPVIDNKTMGEISDEAWHLLVNIDRF